jgi:RNA polymerase sigma factor (sigma-70 family)
MSGPSHINAPSVVELETAPPTVAMALAKAAATGDVRATQELLEMLAPRIAAVVSVVLGRTHPDVDDVLQQSMIAFVQALPSFRGECQPQRFASRIAARTAVASRRRTRGRHARHDDLVDVDTLYAPTQDAFADRRRQLVRSLLESLPEEQAESLTLRVLLGWTLEEISTTMGVPINTVRSRMRLAKEALRRKLDADPALRELLEVES